MKSIAPGGASTWIVPPELPVVTVVIACRSTVTQTFPSSTTTPCGLPPTSIGFMGLAVAASMRLMVPSPLFATHTDPMPTAIPTGSVPTGIEVVTASVTGSMRVTESPSESATHTPPSPTAIALGPSPTVIGVRSPVGSIRVTVFASLSATQTAPAPIATAVGPAFGSTRWTTRAVRGFSRARSPEDGATHTASPRVATLPDPPERRWRCAS